MFSVVFSLPLHEVSIHLTFHVTEEYYTESSLRPKSVTKSLASARWRGSHPPENFQHGVRVFWKIIDRKTINIFLITSLSLPKLSLTRLYSSSLKDVRT